LIGADISIQSQLESGTTFTISTRYPIDVHAKAADGSGHRPRITTSEVESISGKTIAVIEDDPIVLEAYSQALTTRGAFVLKIALEDKAFEEQMAMLDVNGIDFIISDYRLKTRSGAEMINKLREAFNDEIPAVIVTADTSPSHIQYFSNLNIPVLHKPVSFQQVISVIESKLSALDQKKISMD
jgi:DNA-binding NtrC family response regulator